MPELEHTNTTVGLVTADGGDPVTTTLVIAQGTNSDHRSVFRLVRTHQAKFEEFGVLRFEIAKITAGPGRPETYAVLNEYQASLLLTFMRNNEAVVDFKVQLIQAFRRMREELQQRHTPDEPSDARELALQTQLLARRADALASALIATQDALDDEKRNHQDTQEYVKLIEPVAESWLALADARGTFAVADVSAILHNDYGIKIGANRLFKFIGQQGWIYRTRGSRSHWRPYQSQIEAGRLTEKIGERYFDRSDGVYYLGTPQVRVTMKGLHKLRVLLTTKREPVITDDATPLPVLPPGRDPRSVSR